MTILLIHTCFITENAQNRFSAVVTGRSFSFFLICLMGNTSPFNCTAIFLSSSYISIYFRKKSIFSSILLKLAIKDILLTPASSFFNFLLGCLGNMINFDLYSLSLCTFACNDSMDLLRRR